MDENAQVGRTFLSNPTLLLLFFSSFFLPLQLQHGIIIFQTTKKQNEIYGKKNNNSHTTCLPWPHNDDDTVKGGGGIIIYIICIERCMYRKTNPRTRAHNDWKPHRREVLKSLFLFFFKSFVVVVVWNILVTMLSR